MPIQKVKQLNNLLPLVSIGTIADCQSVLETTNRMLVRGGLKILQSKSSQSKGLLEILNKLNFLEKIDGGYILTSQDLAFYLSPILNSSGRVSHARLSIFSLLSEDFQSKNFPELNQLSLDDLTKTLIKTNAQRKNLVKSILDEVESEAKKQVYEGKNLIWLEGDWSKGIIGLLASRLVSQHNLPVVVIERLQDQTKISASLRAPEGYNLPEAMKAVGSELFIKFGGHPGAAGFTTKTTQLAEIKSKFARIIEIQKKTLKQTSKNYLDPKWQEIIKDFSQNFDQKTAQQILDLSLDKSVIALKKTEINPEFLTQIYSLDPFGQDFPLPNLLLLVDSFEIKWLGQEQKHVRINFHKNNYFTVFNIDKNLQQKLLSGRTKKILAKVRCNQNTFRGFTKFDLVAENIWAV